MEIRRGIPVSPGVAIGPVLTLENERFRIPARHISATAVAGEIHRLHRALSAAARDTHIYEKTITQQLGKKYGAIFEAHALLLDDPELIAEIESQVREQKYAAEYAVSTVIRRYAKAFQSVQGSQTFASKATDLYDIERRVLSHLVGERREALKELRDAVIVLAHDLTPSETAQFDPKKVHALATEVGGRTSHTAIIAAALEIPAVVGVGEFLAEVVSGDTVIVDGHHGLLIINPDEETRKKYESARHQYVTFERSLDQLRHQPAVTKDGIHIKLLGNIEFPNEAAHAIEKGAEGIGLYRTEFLYLGRETDPSEAEHLEAYLQVLRALPEGQPLIIRTLDLGADKFSFRSEETADERNPFLGVRSLRLCLQNLPLFKTQLRAILRASAFGAVKILFPMVSTLRELRQCKFLLAEVKEDLEEEGVAFNQNIPVGTMIEVPSAAIQSPQLARDVDYLSIGTNDLVQYTLAADRTNEHVAELYSASDPAVLFLIQRVFDAGRRAGIPVNVCGEMSGDPVYAGLLIGLGLRQLSATPHKLPEVKQLIRSITLAEAEQLAREALRFETAIEVTNFLREHTRRALPDAPL